MEFKTAQEAFNYYRTAKLEDIESRAAAIKQETATNSAANIEALNIELDGLKEAKANIADKAVEQRTAFSPIASMSFETAATPMGDMFASREYRSAFFKTMLNQKLNSEEAAIFQKANAIVANEKRAAFINTTEAAAVIPTQTLNEIYRLAADMGGALSYVRRFDIPANIAIPVATPETMAEWHVEGEEVTPDNKKPINVVFSSHELMKVFSISANARTMSIPAYESYLQQELARVMITALQSAAINGTGIGQPLGLLSDGVITNVMLNQAPDYSTFLKAVAKLKSGYSMGAAWAMNTSTLYNDIMVVRDANGRPLFNEVKDATVDRLIGKPIIIDDFMPDNTIIYGNFSYYAMNYPQDILLEVSRDSSFRKGLIDYRALAIADGKPIVTEAFVKLVLK